MIYLNLPILKLKILTMHASLIADEFAFGAKCLLSSLEAFTTGAANAPINTNKLAKNSTIHCCF